MRKLFAGLIAVALAAAGIGFSVYATRPKENGAQGPRRNADPVFVEVAQVTRRSIQERIEQSATFDAIEMVTILPKVSGILERIHVDLGDRVEKGQLLAEIEDDEFVRRLEQAKANFQLAQAQVEKARLNLEAVRREFDRTEKSMSEGLISERERDAAKALLDTAQADLAIAQAEAARASAARSEAEINLAHTQIAAPIDGIVDRREIDAGTLVSPSTALCNIVRLDPLRVRAFVPESKIRVAEPGKRVVVAVPGMGVQIDGAIERVSPTVDSATQSAEVIVQVENPGGQLRPGMTAKATFVYEEKDAVLTIPVNAIQKDKGLNEVLKVVDGTVATAMIGVGTISDGYAEIVSGLSEGDLVVTRGQFMLREGDAVRYESIEEAQGEQG